MYSWTFGQTDADTQILLFVSHHPTSAIYFLILSNFETQSQRHDYHWNKLITLYRNALFHNFLWFFFAKKIFYRQFGFIYYSRFLLQISRPISHHIFIDMFWLIYWFLLGSFILFFEFLLVPYSDDFLFLADLIFN